MLPIKFGFGYSRSRSSFLVVGYNFAWRLLKGVLVLVMINTEENHNDSLDRYKVYVNDSLDKDKQIPNNLPRT